MQPLIHRISCATWFSKPERKISPVLMWVHFRPRVLLLMMIFCRIMSLLVLKGATRGLRKEKPGRSKMVHLNQQHERDWGSNWQSLPKVFARRFPVYKTRTSKHTPHKPPPPIQCFVIQMCVQATFVGKRGHKQNKIWTNIDSVRGEARYRCLFTVGQNDVKFVIVPTPFGKDCSYG